MAVEGYFGSETYTMNASRATGTLRGGKYLNDFGSGICLELGFRTAAAATGNVRVALYTNSETEQPGALLGWGSIVNPVLGWNNITGLTIGGIALNVYYWIVWQADVSINARYTPGVVGLNTFAYTSQAYGAFPDPFPVATLSDTYWFNQRAGLQISNPITKIINE